MRIPQTLSRIIERVTTRPALRQRYSSRHKLLLRKLQDLTGSRRLAPQQVQLKIENAQPGRLARRRAVALEQIAQPGQQLGERKGLGQVIVTALLQSTHPVIDAAPCRQNQHRCADSQLPQLEDQADSVYIGQTEVNDQYVKRAVNRQKLGRLAVRCCFNLITRFFQ